MAHKKTVFKKYLFVSITILLFSFIMLISMMMFFISRYWQNDKKVLLEKNIQNVSRLVSRDLEYSGNHLIINNDPLMQNFLTTFAFNIDADILVVNKDGKIIMCSEGGFYGYNDLYISDDIISEALMGEFAGIVDFDELYGGRHYIVAVPIVDMHNVPIAVAIAAADTDPISEFQQNILIIFLITSIVILAVAFLVIWMLSHNIVKPISYMSEAADAFSRGDFSKRVPIIKSKDEIGRLAVAFNKMADSLANSENIRRSFIANVSHELKTPMTTISGFIDGILDGTIPKDKHNYYLKTVSSEIKRLSRLVRAMLNLSRIESGALKINKQPFDLSGMLTVTMLSFEKLISEKNITVEGLDSIKHVRVSGDSDMINQVIYNLIENAVKFTNVGGYIKVQASEDSSYVNVSIENSGHGISSEEMKFVFDKFYKTDKSRSEDKNGIGLGLYIVKSIINLHKGKICVDSEENKYCRFSFSIPK